MQTKTNLRGLTFTFLLVNLILLFAGACKNKTEEAKKHFDLGVLYEEQKQPEDAIREFKQVLQLNPQYAEAHYHLGVIYHTLDAYSSAIQEYEKVISIDPKFPRIHTSLGHVYYVRAMKAWGRAAKLNQLDFWLADTTKQLGYKDRNELVELINDCQSKLKADTMNAEIFSKLSQANYLLAVEEYQKAIQADPSDTSAQLYLGLTYLEQGYPNKLMTQYEILKTLDPRQAEILLTMLKQREKENQYIEELKKKPK